jgi:hypothetical protein
MYKACSKCGKIHPANYKCNVGRTYTGGQERKLRKTYAWQMKSVQVRERAAHLCEVCRDNGRYTYNGLEVHHIIKLKDAPDRLLDDSNLICLCVEHHKQADAGMLSQDYLFHLVEVREQGTAPLPQK